MKNLFVVALSVVLLTSCGLKKIAEDTRDGVSESNQTQKQLLSSIKKTEDAVHLQILSLAVHQMLDPVNSPNLALPLRIIAPAEVFAKEATVDELVRFAYLMLRDANNATNEKEKLEIGRISLNAAMAISGMAPQAKFEEAIRIHVDESGRFEETVCAMAYSRYSFIMNLLFNPILDARPLNMGSLKEAVKYFKQMKAIADSKHASRFKLLVEALEVNRTVDPKKLTAAGQTAIDAFQDEKKAPGLRSQAGAEALLNELRY